MSYRNKNLVLEVLKQPEHAGNLTLPQWDLLIRQGRSASLLAKLYSVLKNAGVLESVPTRPFRHLESDWIAFESHRRAIFWEERQIKSALEELNVPVIFLKGAAYLLDNLPAGEGRIFNDTDLLVPKDRITKVEKTLLMNGWAPDRKDEYDEQYYRLWMHEIPPMRHVKRKTVLDVHHNILPETSRHVPDAGKLIERMVPLGKNENFGMLCPEDMVLHSAAHLFHEGELENGFRDLLDLDSLFRQFGEKEEFWFGLTSRSEELKISRSLYYGIKLTRWMFNTPIPDDVNKGINKHGPFRPLNLFMIFVYRNALVPNHSTCRTFFTGFSRIMLYIRSHYIRMPLKLLIPHLFRKFMKRHKLQAGFWHAKE